MRVLSTAARWSCAVLARVRDERGQSFVEWLGGTVVMIGVVITIFAVKPSLGEQVRCATGAQIDRILSIDASGDCRLKDSEPVRRAPQGLAPTPRAAQNRLDRDALRPTRP